MVNKNRFSPRVLELIRAALAGTPQRQVIANGSKIEFAIALQREISLQGFEHVDTRMSHRGSVQTFRREGQWNLLRMQVIEKGNVISIEML